MSRDEIVRAVRRERRRTLALLRELEPGRFDLPTALPGRRIREVVAHLITTDRASVLGANLPLVLTSTDRVERWNDRQVAGWADRSVPELLVGLGRWGSRFAAFAARLPKALYGLRMPTMYGRAPGGLLIWARAFDEWVHRQDIRRALGLPDEVADVRDAAEVVLRAAAAGMPGWAAGSGRVLVQVAAAPMEPWVFDLGDRTAAPAAGDDAVARVSVPGPAFVMAAAGRDSFEDLRMAGALSIEGDEAAARRLLGLIRVV